VVEATAAAGVSSSTTRKWLDLLLKKIDGDSKVSETATSTAAQGDTPQSFEDLPKIQYALIAYGSWDGSTQAPIQFSSWCANLTELFDWLDGVQYVGGASNKGLALTEALAQAIIMSKYPYPDGSRPTPAGVCPLAAGSDPSCSFALHYIVQVAVNMSRFTALLHTDTLCMRADSVLVGVGLVSYSDWMQPSPVILPAASYRHTCSSCPADYPLTCPSPTIHPPPHCYPHCPQARATTSPH
jgi:hypothetical protein